MQRIIDQDHDELARIKQVIDANHAAHGATHVELLEDMAKVKQGIDTNCMSLTRAP